MSVIRRFHTFDAAGRILRLDYDRHGGGILPRFPLASAHRSEAARMNFEEKREVARAVARAMGIELE